MMVRWTLIAALLVSSLMVVAPARVEAQTSAQSAQYQLWLARIQLLRRGGPRQPVSIN